MRATWAGVALSAVFLASGSAFAAQPAGPKRVESATAGISIERPSGWRDATVAQLAENREKIRLSDAGLERALKERATPALIAFMKHPEPYPDINPSIQIVLRPALENMTAARVLSVTLDVLKKAHPDLMVVEPIRDVEVGGRRGAGMKVSYTLRTTDGGEFEVLGRTWVVPRGKFLVLVGMSGAQQGPDVAEEEFAAAFRSLEIDP